MRIAGDTYDHIAMTLNLEREDCKRLYNLHSKMLAKLDNRKCPKSGKGRKSYLRSEIYRLKNNGVPYSKISNMFDMRIKDCHTYYEREQSRINKGAQKNALMRVQNPNWNDLKQIRKATLGHKTPSAVSTLRLNGLEPENITGLIYG